MKILLDTHIFLWFVTGDGRLPKKYEAAIKESANEVYLSVASIWEACIKYQLGKLPLPQAPEVLLPLQRAVHSIESLPIDEASVGRLAGLPALHRDPFDRIMVCQAIQHDLILASLDVAVRAYPVKILEDH